MVLPEFDPDTGPVGSPQAYDNIYEAWKDWLQQFENISRLNHITEHRYNYFLEVVGKPFKKQFMLKKFGDTYDKLMESLDKHFKKKKSLNIVRFNILRSPPENGESDWDWIGRIEDVVHKAEFEMMTKRDALLLILLLNTSNDDLRKVIIEKELCYEAALRWLKDETNLVMDDNINMQDNIYLDRSVDSDLKDIKNLELFTEEESNSIQHLAKEEADFEDLQENSIEDETTGVGQNNKKMSTIDLENVLNSNTIKTSQKLLNRVNDEKNIDQRLVMVVASLKEDGQFNHKAIETDIKFDTTNAKNRVNVKMKCEFCKAEHVVRKHFRPNTRHYHQHDDYFSKDNPRASCEECNEIFTKHGDVRNHVHSVPDRQFKCSDCPKSYDKLVQLRAHIKVFEKKVDMKCPYCPNISSTKHAYERHKREELHSNRSISTEKKRFSCDLCEFDDSTKEFTNKAQLQYHKQKIHKTNPNQILKCNYCDYTTKYKPNLRIHTKKHLDIIKDDEKQKYLCTICGFNASTRATLKKHEKTHRERKKDLCPLCGSAVIDVKNHINESHKKIGTFPCDVCGKVFARESGLKQHMRVHLELELCQVCNTGVRSVVLHMKSAHGITVEKPKCPHCNKEFLYKYIMDEHVNKIHVNVKHICSECGQDFPSKVDLSNHVFFEHRKLKYECLVCGEAQIDIWRHLKQKHNILAKTGSRIDGKYRIIKRDVSEDT